ncbi:hypothetical protein [Legionella sp. WA2022007384]
MRRITLLLLLSSLIFGCHTQQAGDGEAAHTKQTGYGGIGGAGGTGGTGGPGGGH